ncbi:MAG: hypothetical protein ACM31I_01800, partial [Deltaproteobacteria bacterium]
MSKSVKLSVKLIANFGILLLILVAAVFLFRNSSNDMNRKVKGVLDVEIAIAGGGRSMELAAARCRTFEKEFLLTRNRTLVADADGAVAALKAEAGRVSALAREAGYVEISDKALKTATLADGFQRDFTAVAAAADRKGLDRGSEAVGRLDDSSRGMEAAAREISTKAGEIADARGRSV